MSKNRAQRRFLESWVDIVLTVVSIIQGLAFNDLVIRFPAILENALSAREYQVLGHFVLCFAVLLRLFQTYVTAALDYDEWTVGFFDIFLVFVIGAVEYFVFSTLTPTNFDVVGFHIRISIISLLGIVGYLGAWLRLKEEAFPTYLQYHREAHLQSVNIIGVVLIQVISIFVIVSPRQSDSVYTVLALCSTLILVLNIFYSLKTTFHPSVEMVPLSQATASSRIPERDSSARPEVIVKTAERENVRDLLDLIMEYFSYIYVAVFDTSPRLTRRILNEIILFHGGKHTLGYRSFYLAFDKNNGKCVGLMMLGSRKIANASAVFTVIGSTFSILRHLGMFGLVRVMKNTRVARADLPLKKTDELSIIYLAVSHSCRRSGIGKQLIQFARAIAITMGGATIVLDVRERNERAHEFFLVQGFVDEAYLVSDSDSIFDQGRRIHMKLSV